MKSVLAFMLIAGLFSNVFGGIEVQELADVQVAKSLSGIVVDSGQFVLPTVHVFEVTQGWKSTLRSTATDAKGKWSLPPVAGRKVYYLRFVKDGFNELRVRVELDRKRGKELKFTLHFAT